MATTREERIVFSSGMKRRPTKAESVLNRQLRWMKSYVGKKGQSVLLYSRQKLKLEYILDFYLVRCRLCVEVDGSSHSPKKQQEYDKRRDQRLEAIGIKTIRFTNEEVIASPLEVVDKIYKEALLRFAPKHKKTKKRPRYCMSPRLAAMRSLKF